MPTGEKKMYNYSLLIVDDEHDMLAGLTRLLGKHFEGLEILTAESGEQALEIINRQSVDAALVDIQMPGMNGLDLLTMIERKNHLVTAIVMTAYGSIDVAVEAMKRGAYDFITKPFDKERLLLLIRKALERCRLLRENNTLKKKVGQRTALTSIIGNSHPIESLLESIRTIAPTNYTVLVRGESGTGKELVAKAVHELSGRSAKPLVTVNCPAIPEHLLESELFGHFKGSFTGADKDFKGLFAEADGGSICLDEIGDVPINIQMKLLRVLQENEIRPLGGRRPQQVDVRVIALTNQNLEQKISERAFREDLFYRLNVVTLRTPPLRDIREDIPLLAAHFVKQTCRELETQPKVLSADALERLTTMDWPGNVRELQNVIRRTIMFCPDQTVTAGHLKGIAENPQVSRPDQPMYENDSDAEIQHYKEAKERLNRVFEEMYIRRLLEKTEGNVTRAARMCGLTRAALQKIMRRSGIRSSSFREDKDKVA